MKLETTREALLKPLQLASGVVERRQTLPVLANLLVVAEKGVLTLSGTDLEVEVQASISEGVDIKTEGRATLPARKLMDIWRSLPEGAAVSITVDGTKSTVRSGRSRFTLATLPAADFPSVEGGESSVELTLEQPQLKRLIDRVSFSMAQQDVRYFLNGMLLEVDADGVRTVATDGHRLAQANLANVASEGGFCEAIVPRKGVGELSRLVSDSDATVSLAIGKGHLRATQGEYTLTTKLVDGQYPPYKKVIPQGADQTLVGDRETLKQAFYRAAILSNEKYRGVRLSFENDLLTIQANNPEQEEAEESVAVDYAGDSMEIGFNVSYLQDIMSVINTDSVRISLTDANSSALVEGDGEDDVLYVVMPMRL